MDYHYKSPLEKWNIFTKSPLKKWNISTKSPLKKWNLNIQPTTNQQIDMIKRKIEEQFLKWKNTEGHNPLVVKGCRQCGKTYSVLEFARRHYKHVVYVNFFENPAFTEAFEGSMQVDTIIMYLTTIAGSDAVFEPHNTCLILDEIQECPKARTSLKFFKLDGRYDVICTGSLLGISGYRDEPASIPVGYESQLTMYPLDFEEFLWANGVPTSAIDELRGCISTITPVPGVLHNRFRELLLQYAVVGGMPAVVSDFVESHMMNRVLDMQRAIVNGYRDDMMKYAPNKDKSKIRECFDSIPRQLSKENKKFQYSIIKKGVKAKDFVGSLQWIEDAGIIQRCHNLNITELPLAGNVDENTFKIYMTDIGLLISMLEDGTQADIMRGSLLGYKGAIFENLVADMLSKAGRKLYYFRKDSGLEVDFVMRLEGECVLVECKAASGNIKSTKTILQHYDKYHVRKAIKLGDYNVGRVEAVTTLPLYAGFLLAASEQ